MRSPCEVFFFIPPEMPFFRSEERTIFVYGYAKSRRANIDEKELRIFKHDAKDQLAMIDERLDAMLRNKDLIEVFVN